MNDLVNQIIGYLHGIWPYRWGALAIAWFVAVPGWMFIYSIPNQYQTSAIVNIDADSILNPLLEGLALDRDSSSEIDLVTRLLLNRENLMSVIRDTDMDLEANTPAERFSLAEKLAKTIKLTEEGDFRRSRKGVTNKTYKIEYEAPSAQLVYQVVNKLLNSLIENTLNSSRTDTLNAQKFIDAQIAEHEQRLVASELRLAEFKKHNLGMMPNDQGGYYSRLQSVLDDVESIQTELRLAKREHSELKQQLKSENPMLVGGLYGVDATATKLTGYREELADLLTQYTDQHPDVQALNSKINDLMNPKKARKVSEGSNKNNDSANFNPVYQDIKAAISRAGVAIETLKIRLAEKEFKVEKLRASVDLIPEVEARLSKLNRDYQNTNDRYLILIDRRESARLAQRAAQDSSAISINIIEPPFVPNSPSGPNRMLLLAGVLVAALGAGLGWCAFRYLMCPTFISFNQLRDVTGLPVLGAVSLYVRPSIKRRRRLELASFMTGIVFLLFVFGTVVFFQDAGALYVSQLLSDSSLPL